MFIKKGALLLTIIVAIAWAENQNWDIAVGINEQVELLSLNGSKFELGFLQPFHRLKALAFDSKRRQLFVSDMEEGNDTIYSFHLNKETDVTSVVQDLPDDVQGLAIDPVDDILYWTDSMKKTISFVHLNDTDAEREILFNFSNEHPQDLVVDMCRRYLYWTNSNSSNPTIESSLLNGKDRKVLVDKDLFVPTGIAVDQVLGRLYWTDRRQGIYFRIESIKFDGSDRQIFYEGTHQSPFGLAVNKNHVFWTDGLNNALWRKSKVEGSEPEKMREFDDNPRGIVLQNLGFPGTPSCNKVFEITNSTEYSQKNSLKNKTKVACNECLNNGYLNENCTCTCPNGYTGEKCEKDLCYNYCNKGTCYIDPVGKPKCQCEEGFTGPRCAENKCDNYCLNDGICAFDENGTFCTCLEGFSGSRCELAESSILSQLCGLVCQNMDYSLLENHGVICSCQDGLAQESSMLSSSFTTQDVNFYFHDIVFIVSFLMIIFLTSLIIGLLIFLFVIIKKRPRIRKRIIVNKNITPLNYMPQPPSEQCEITIENCCNMNVCETPCFEPPGLRNFHSTKKDEKKTLLANMENGGEDFY